MKSPATIILVAALYATTLSLSTVSAAALNVNHLWGGQAPLLGGSTVSQQQQQPPPGPPVPGNSTLRHCKEPKDDILTIERVDIDPNPPLPGHNLTIWATGTTSADIGAGAYVNVEIKYGYIRLLQKRLDICENAGQLNLTCPIKEGKFVLMKQVTLPGVIPPGKYHAIADAFNYDDVPITCVQADIFFKPQHPRS